MLRVSVRDNEKIDEKEEQKLKTERKKGVTQAIRKVWELNDLLCKSMNWFLYDNSLLHERVKLGFFRLICTASLIFKSNLELALSIMLKERELYESKHVMVESRCLKIWDLLSFFTCSSILVSKWQQISPI